MSIPSKVLIVEDEPNFYSDCLSRWDKSFIDTSNMTSLEEVQSAIEIQIPAVKPDLFILDLELLRGQLPEESIQILRHVIRHLDSIPVLVVSKRYSSSTRGRIMDLGGIDLIDKNHILDKKSLLDDISLLIAGNFAKSSWPFSYLEHCRIGITNDADNAGERIIGNQSFQYFVPAAFEELLNQLLRAPRICPDYFLYNREGIRLTNGAIQHLTDLAQSKEKLEFTILKNKLRNEVAVAYQQGVSSALEIHIEETSKVQANRRAASIEERNFTELEEMVSQCISLGKPPQDIDGFQEKFLKISSETPDILTEEQKHLFRVFSGKPVAPAADRPHQKKKYAAKPWHEQHVLKSLFLALLIGLAAGILTWLIALQPSYILGLSAIIFCLTAFVLIKNDPKNKYFRAGRFVIVLIGVVNILPSLDTAFQISEKTSNPLWSFFIKLNIQDTWYVSVLAFLLSVVLFIIQYRIDTGNSSKNLLH